MNPTYRIETIRIDADSIERLAKMKNPRKIVSSHVKKLLGEIKKNGKIDQPFVVSKNGGDFVLIDGNHRLAAYQEWIKQNPNASAAQDFYIYPHLSQEEEVEIFTKWNSGRRQSSNDFVFLHQDQIPVFQMMKKSFPTKIKIYTLTGKEQGVHFVSLAKAYLTTRVPAKENAVPSYMGSNFDFVKDVEKLDTTDYFELKKFVEFFESIFGKMERDNSYQTTTGLTALCLLYFRNVPKCSEDSLRRKLKRKVLGRGWFLETAKFGGRTGVTFLYQRLLSELNGGSSSEFI